MAKSARSNSQKKLRTQRRDEVVKKTKWLATADDKRQAALAACAAAAPLDVPRTAAEDVMETAEKPLATVRVKKTQKLKGAVVKKGKNGKKVSVLAGKNQFFKKGRKGARN